MCQLDEWVHIQLKLMRGWGLRKYVFKAYTVFSGGHT